MAKGGKRPGAGRPRGAKDKATIEKEAVLAQYRLRIMQKADELLNAQFSLAEGISYLIRVDSKKGRPDKHVIVTDPEEIKDYFDKKTKGYYYITTKDPDSGTIDSMLDRTFGRATQAVEVGGTGGGPIQFIPILGGITNVPGNDSNKQATEVQEANQGS